MYESHVAERVWLRKTIIILIAHHGVQQLEFVMRAGEL